MKILYFDCFAGISGDMTLGAFLDLGVKEETLISELKKLDLDGYRIEVTKKLKNGLSGTDVDVILEDVDAKSSQEKEVKSHLAETLNIHHHAHVKDHDGHHHHGEHNHDEGHNHAHHSHTHHHRSYKDIREMIDRSQLSEEVKALSQEMFLKVAAAEAKIHGKTIDVVHVHEVGAVDSIVDLVGAALCFDA